MKSLSVVLVHEDHATEKRCVQDISRRCVSKQCMGWVHQVEEDQDYPNDVKSTGFGYCGLVNPPKV